MIDKTAKKYEATKAESCAGYAFIKGEIVLAGTSIGLCPCFVEVMEGVPQGYIGNVKRPREKGQKEDVFDTVFLSGVPKGIAHVPTETLGKEHEIKQAKLAKAKEALAEAEAL